MGYSFSGTGMKALDSDNAAGLASEICESIVGKLRKGEKLKDNQFNTEGIINVALFLQELETPALCNDAIYSFLKDFVVRFEKHIAKEEKGDWEDGNNKRSHIRRYQNVLKNLKAKLKKLHKELNPDDD